MIGRLKVKIRASRKLLLWRGEVRAVLVSAIHGLVPGHLPLDQLNLIGLGQHLGENIFQVPSSPNRRCSFHRLLLTEALGRLASGNLDPMECRIVPSTSRCPIAWRAAATARDAFIRESIK